MRISISWDPYRVDRRRNLKGFVVVRWFHYQSNFEILKDYSSDKLTSVRFYSLVLQDSPSNRSYPLCSERPLDILFTYRTDEEPFNRCHTTISNSGESIAEKEMGSVDVKAVSLKYTTRQSKIIIHSNTSMRHNSLTSTQASIEHLSYARIRAGCAQDQLNGPVEELRHADLHP